MRLRTCVAAGLLCALAAMGQQKQPTKEPQTKAKVGDAAPDFTLPSTTGQDIRLSDYQGKNNVVLAFVVKAFTGG